MNLQQNVVFRVALFTLGTLPQLVKLFSMGGIPFTKTWASLYFGSFLILEVGVYFFRAFERDAATHNTASSPIRSGDSPEKGVEWKLRAAVIILSNTIVLYPLGISAFEIAKMIGPRPWPYVVGLCILCITPLLDKLWLQRETVTLIQTLVLFPNLLGVFLSCCVLLPLSDRARATDSGTTIGLHICAGILVAVVISINAFYWTKSMIGLDIRSKEIEVGLGSFQAVLNLGTALLYYAFKYNPNGTYKPSWVNQLG